MLKRYFQIDVDGDGTISLEEFKTMMERLNESNEEDDRQLLEDTFNVRKIFNVKAILIDGGSYGVLIKSLQCGSRLIKRAKPSS